MVDHVELPTRRSFFQGAAWFSARLPGSARRRAFLAGIAAAIGLLWVGTAITFLHERDAARMTDEKAALATAQSAVDEIALRFAAVDAALTAASMRAGGGADTDWATVLETAAPTAPFSSGLVFLAAYKTNGRLVHRTDMPAGHVETIAAMEHFRAPIDRGVAGMHVGHPYTDPATGRVLLPLVRRHPGAGQALRAIMVAALDVEMLSSRLARHAGVLALARSDGTVLAVAGGSGTQGTQDLTAPAADGAPILAAVSVGSAASETTVRHGLQLAAAAAVGTICLAVFGLVGRRRREPAAPRESADVSYAKSRLLATMSHEFRTPLNAVIGFAQVIRDQAPNLPAEKVADYAGDIAGSGERLLQMVNDILDLSNIEAGRYELQPEPVDLTEIAAAVNAIVAPLAKERQVTLVDAAIAEDVSLTADRRALKQVLYNLVHNGVKFSEAGGIVSITGVKGPGGMVRLDIVDNGVGVPPRDLDRIMRPFEQSGDILTTSNSGTGLGLALVGKLAGLHGGRVELASVEGEGTTVSVYLPAC